MRWELCTQSDEQRTFDLHILEEHQASKGLCFCEDRAAVRLHVADLGQLAQRLHNAVLVSPGGNLSGSLRLPGPVWLRSQEPGSMRHKACHSEERIKQHRKLVQAARPCSSSKAKPQAEVQE